MSYRDHDMYEITVESASRVDSGDAKLVFRYSERQRQLITLTLNDLRALRDAVDEFLVSQGDAPDPVPDPKVVVRLATAVKDSTDAGHASVSGMQVTITKPHLWRAGRYEEFLRSLFRAGFTVADSRDEGADRFLTVRCRPDSNAVRCEECGWLDGRHSGGCPIDKLASAVADYIAQGYVAVDGMRVIAFSVKTWPLGKYDLLITRLGSADFAVDDTEDRWRGAHKILTVQYMDSRADEKP